MLNISIKLDGLEAFKNKLDPARTQKILARALDKTAQQGKVAIQKEIRRIYNLKLKDLSEQVGVHAKPSELEVVIYTQGKRTPLIQFDARQQGVKYNRQAGTVRRGGRFRGASTGGVSVEIIRGQRKVIKGAFITSVGTGQHIGVFKRVGNKRLPIREKVTIGSPQMFGSHNVMDAARRRIAEQWPGNIAHEINRAGKGK
ncbi:MAG TPA: phage tail protein [Dissulfurispiraceae bacterium]|nr:phage tail protein [Dissulfurispiraceae bacterium]